MRVPRRRRVYVAAIEELYGGEGGSKFGRVGYKAD